MNVGHERYKRTWETYWTTLPPTPGQAFWDSAPDLAASLDLPRLLEVFHPKLPVVDFGCGNGTQTRFLGGHFERVIGVDVSEAAIRAARELTTESNVTYESLDGTDRAAVERFHARVGDANVYMRTVLHQMLPEHRPALADAVRRIMGKSGAAYLLELSDEAHGFFEALASNGGAPPQLVRVLECGITPGLLCVEDVRKLFPDAAYELKTGPSIVNTVHVAADGARTQVPAFYATVAPKSRQS